MRRFLVPSASNKAADADNFNNPAKRMKTDDNSSISIFTTSTSSVSSVESSMISSVSVVSSAITGSSPRYRENILLPSYLSLASQCASNTWIEHPGILLKLRSSPSNYQGIIALDMDGTVIATKSGKKFAVNDQDWQFWHPNVVTTLRKYHHEHQFAIALISNQAGIRKGKQSIIGLQKKVDDIIDALDLPIDFICSLDNDIYRKPRTGMWHFLAAARWAESLHHDSNDLGNVASRFIYVGKSCIAYIGVDCVCTYRLS
jgi:DNA 3'-phosphatase